MNISNETLGRIKHASPKGLRNLGRRSVRLYAQQTSRRRVLPDFLVIGTKRGGTTSLYNALRNHPQVIPMFPAAEDLKSPHYFDLNFDRSVDWYRSHFPTESAMRREADRQGHAVVCGEASPYYLFHPLGAERVASVVPRAKIVVLLRNPVSRAYSHYWERVANDTEPLSFADAIAAEPARLAGERERLATGAAAISEAFEHSSYLARGRYLEQLMEWEKHFPREQILIMQSELLYREPTQTFARVAEFLGLEPHEDRYPHRNETVGKNPMEPAVRDRLRAYFKPHNEALFAHLGEDYGWND